LDLTDFWAVKKGVWRKGVRGRHGVEEIEDPNAPSGYDFALGGFNPSGGQSGS